MNVYIKNKNIIRASIMSILMVLGSVYAISDAERVNVLSHQLSNITIGQLSSGNIDEMVGKVSVVYSELSRDDLKEQLRNSFAEFLTLLTNYYDASLRSSARNALDLAGTMKLDNDTTDLLSQFVSSEQSRRQQRKVEAGPSGETDIQDLLTQQSSLMRELKNISLEQKQLEQREEEIRLLLQTQTFSDEETTGLIEEREQLEATQNSLEERRREVEQQLGEVRARIDRALTQEKTEPAISVPSTRPWLPQKPSRVGPGIIRQRPFFTQPQQGESSSTADASTAGASRQDNVSARAQQLINEFVRLNFGVQLSFPEKGKISGARFNEEQAEVDSQIKELKTMVQQPNADIRASFTLFLEILAQHFKTLQDMINHHEAHTTQLFDMPTQAVRIAQELDINNDALATLRDGTYRYNR